MLTGDKVETARTIGFSCNLLQEGMTIHEVLHKDKEMIKRDLDYALEQMKADASTFLNNKRAIVVAGDALTTLMPDEELSKKVPILSNISSMRWQTLAKLYSAAEYPQSRSSRSSS